MFFNFVLNYLSVNNIYELIRNFDILRSLFWWLFIIDTFVNFI